MKLAHVLLLLQPETTKPFLVCTEIVVPNHFVSVLHKYWYRRAFCRLYFCPYVSYQCLLKRVFKFLSFSLIWLASSVILKAMTAVSTDSYSSLLFFNVCMLACCHVTYINRHIRMLERKCWGKGMKSFTCQKEVDISMVQ